MNGIKILYPLPPSPPSSLRIKWMYSIQRGPLQFNFILGSNFIFLCFWVRQLTIISFKQKKLNLNLDVMPSSSLCTRPSHILTNTVCPLPPLRLRPISNTPFSVASLSMLTVSVTISVFLFLWSRFVGPMPNPQPGELGGHSLSAFYPSISSALAGPTSGKRLQPTYM